MDTTEKTKLIEIDGHKFILNKMDALTGSRLLPKFLKILKPILKNLDIQKITNSGINEIEAISSLLNVFVEGLSELPDEDFKKIQESSLKVVQEVLGAGAVFVLNKATGEWEGSQEIKDNIGLVMNLTLRSLYFNYAGFFPEKLLTSLTAQLNTFQQSSEI
jgi:hypothetical protein